MYKKICEHATAKWNEITKKNLNLDGKCGAQINHSLDILDRMQVYVIAFDCGEWPEAVTIDQRYVQKLTSPFYL